MFVCETLKEKEKNGNLRAVGVRWSEARIFWDRLLNIFANLALFVGVPITLFGVACLVLGERGAEIIIPGGLLIVVGYGLSRLAANMGGVPRELWFRRDGTMPAPYGLAAYPSRHRSVSGKPSDVASIEAVQLVFLQPPAVAFHGHGVKLYKRCGQITLIAKHLDTEQAHMLAVKLTDALATLRADAVASTIRNAAARGDKYADVLID